MISQSLTIFVLSAMYHLSFDYHYCFKVVVYAFDPVWISFSINTCRRRKKRKEIEISLSDKVKLAYAEVNFLEKINYLVFPKT